jgi:hypothetical protein
VIVQQNSKITVWLLAFVAVGTSLLGPAPVWAQVTGATLTGTVTDASRAVIPNAQVSIKSIATGITTVATANADGFYTAPNLIPGIYAMSASAPGFSTQVQTGVTLTVGAQQVLNFTLKVGTVTDKVEVTGEAPSVELATSSISAVVNSITVRELPLNGRSWTDLASLQIGVSAIQTQLSATGSADRGARGFGAQITVAGARPQQNNYRLDGISINDNSNGAPGSVLGGNLGVDAIQEFSVLTSNYSAEYGKTSGGVINAITRSGTNQFHGSVYEFLRNSALDARNFFDTTIPPFTRNQFGADAGAPIRKDKTFIFGDYEGIRQSKGVTAVDTVPSAAARAGTLSTGTVTVDPSVQKYLGFWPLPNGPILPPGDIGVFTIAQQQVVGENFFTTRVDNRFSGKDSLFATYMYDNASFTFPDSLNTVLYGHHTNRHIAVLGEDHSFSPSLVNFVRVGFNRAAVSDLESVSAINPLAGDPTLGAVPGRYAAGVNVSGLTPLLAGLSGPTHYFFYWNSFQGYDDAALTHGTHFLKFGVALERMQLNQLTLGNPSGVFTFGSLSQFITNQPHSFSTAFPQLITPRDFRQTLFGAYVQDDWRALRNLTVNLGLRWEMTTVPTEVQNKLTNLINITDPTVHVGNPLFLNPTLRNFEPHLGFSWDPFQDGKTAVRGGFGVFDVLPLPYLLETSEATSTPFSLLGSSSKLPAGSFFAGAYSLLNPSSLRATYIQHQPARSYAMQWNVNIQRELSPNLTAMVGYVGSRGVHLPIRTDDANMVIPKFTSAGYLWPSPVGSGNQINPAFGTIKGLFFNGNSFFDALELQLSKRMSRGLQVQGSFTWGKSIDDGSSTVTGDTFSNSIAAPQWYAMKSNRGLSDYNVARTLVINAVWEVPQAKSLSGPAALLVNGWQLNAIYKVSDGVPFTATFGAAGGDPLGINNSVPYDFPDRLKGPGCNSLVNPGNPSNYIKTQCFAIPSAPNMAYWTANCDPQPLGPGTALVPFPQCFNLRGNAGRNILIGPGLTNLDFSIFKNNYIKRISEHFNAQFRAEFFNILNHPNFAVPVSPDNADIFDATGAPTGVAGLLTSTTTTAREIQFAVKLIW